MEILEVSNILADAESQCRVVKPLTEQWPDMDIKDAYGIQLETIAGKIKQGETLIGMKVGLTSRGMMKAIGVNEPDFGHLTDKMLINEGTPIKIDELIQPKVEGELAFILKKTLQGPGITLADVYDSVDYVVPAIEIVDSRIANWKIKLLDTVADNGSSAKLILGSKFTPIAEVDMRLTGMLLEKNGELLNSGTLAEVLGNPAASVAWLANKLCEFGIALEAGSIILSGAVTAAENAVRGDVFTVSFQGMGSVGAKFI